MITARFTNPGLRLVAAISASISLLALVLQVLGILPMVFFLTFFGVPSILLLFALAAYGKWIEAVVFVNALSIGLLGGFAGTLAYDGVRFLLQKSGIFPGYDGFIPIYIFGSWITSQATTTTAAAIAGWFYHFWNGLSFGIFYALIFSRRNWLFGVAYGIFMEMCMLGLFPMFLHVTNKFDFIALSMIGHLAYGAVLGKIVQVYGYSWEKA